MKYTLQSLMLVIIILVSNVNGEIICSRDYGGHLVIGECFYKSGENYKTLNEVTGFSWSGGLEGGFLFDAPGINEPFSFTLKPYLVMQNGNVYGMQTIKNNYPSMNFHNYIYESPNAYKWALNITAIPVLIQDNIRFIALQVEGSQGITWQEVDLQPDLNRIVFKNEVVFDYNDLIAAGFTLQLYNRTTLLIGNISGKQTLDLDPLIYLNSSAGKSWGDTFISSADTGFNGGSVNLKLDSRFNTGIYFGYSLADIPAGQTIINATFHLFHNSYDYSGGARGYEIYNTTLWSENGINWTNNPCKPSGVWNHTSCNATSFGNFSGSVSNWRDLNVTYIVKNAYDNGWKNVSWILTHYSPGLFIAYFSSKENSYKPWLDVWYDTGVTTTTTTTTTLLVSPQIGGCRINASVVYPGDIVYTNATTTEKTNPLDTFTVTLNDSDAVTNASVDGVSYLLIDTTSLLGNYSVNCSVNDTSNNVNSTLDGWLNVVTTTTTTIISPFTTNCALNQTEIYQGGTVKLSMIIYNGTYPTCYVQGRVNGSVFSQTGCVSTNGSRSFSWSVGGNLGNWSASCWLNDTMGNNNETWDNWINVLPSTTTTTTIPTTTTTVTTTTIPGVTTTTSLPSGYAQCEAANYGLCIWEFWRDLF